MLLPSFTQFVEKTELLSVLLNRFIFLSGTEYFYLPVTYFKKSGLPPLVLLVAWRRWLMFEFDWQNVFFLLIFTFLYCK